MFRLADALNAAFNRMVARLSWRLNPAGVARSAAALEAAATVPSGAVAMARLAPYRLPGEVDTTALARLCACVAAAPDAGAVAAILADAVAEVVGVPAAVALDGEHPLCLGAASGFRRAVPRGCPIDLESGPCALAWQRQEPLQVEAGLVQPSELQRALRTEGVRTVLLVPLVARGTTLGLMLMGAGNTHNFGAGALSAAALLAAHAGLVLDSLRLVRDVQNREELAAGAAHELRNGLAVVRGRVQLARGRGAAAHLAVVLSEVDRVTALLEDLLRLTRPLQLAPAQVTLAAVAEEALTAQAGAIAARALRLERRFDPAAPLVTADPARMRQVCENLLTNAIAGLYTGGAVTVSTGSEGEWAFLRVEDNGSGVATEAMPHLFTPFYSTRPDGAGLGLAVCQRIVAAHGGRIQVANLPGIGAAFTVLLPLQDSASTGSEY